MLKLLTKRRLLATTSTWMGRRTVMASVETDGKQGIKGFQEIPGPTGIYQWAFLGFRLQMKPFTKFKITRLDQLMAAYQKRYGDICKVRMGNRWMVFLFDPTAIETAFRNEAKYPIRPSLLIVDHFFKNQTCPSFSILQGRDWYTMRRPVQQAMKRPRSMDKFVPKLSEIADDFVDKFRHRDVIENLPLPCMEFTTEGAGALCFATRLGCIKTNDDERDTVIFNHVRGLFGVIGESVFTIPWFLLYDTPKYKRFVEHVLFLRSLGQGYVQKAKEEIDDGRYKDGEANLMVDMISTTGMTETMAATNLVDLFMAGIDSTALAISFLLFQLAKNPDKQEKLFEEVRDRIPITGHIPEDALNNLPYLRACLKESFRLVFPVSVGATRILDKDIQLLGYNIPKGCILGGGNSVIGKEEKYFSQPKVFMPERWLRTGESNIHPFAQLPFGFGIRDCIGKRFAEAEVFICVSKMVRNYRISLPDGLTDVPYIYQTFATPEKHFSLRIHQR